MIFRPSVRTPFGAAAADVKAAGFNLVTLFDDFDDLSGIDINVTLNPGYRLYTKTHTAACSATDFSIANSILTFDTTGSSGRALLTRGYVGSPGLTVGKDYGGGGYYEIRYSILAGTFSETFWMQDNAAQFLVADGGHANFGEIDMAEFFQQSNQASATEDNGIWCWTDATAVSGGQTFYSPVDMTQMHTFGCLWQTMAQNGGTGRLRFYLDGVLQSGTLTYTATDPAAILDTSHMSVWLSNVAGKQLVDYLLIQQAG